MGDFPILVVLALVLLALLVGSFLGVVVDRLPRRMSLVAPRSHCGACKTRLGLRDLVPVASFALTRGRCRYCDAAIPKAWPLIELAAVAVVIWAMAVVPPRALPPTLLLGWSLLALAFIDGRHMILPDRITLPLMVLGLGVGFWLPGLDWRLHLAGALAGLAVFAAIRAIYFALRGVEGLGLGDVKLFGAAGAWLGIGGLPTMLLIAAVSGLVFVLLRDRTLRPDRAIPFGVFLCVGLWLTWLYGPIALVF